MKTHVAQLQWYSCWLGFFMRRLLHAVLHGLNMTIQTDQIWPFVKTPACKILIICAFSPFSLLCYTKMMFKLHVMTRWCLSFMLWQEPILNVLKTIMCPLCAQMITGYLYILVENYYKSSQLTDFTHYLGMKTEAMHQTTQNNFFKYLL